MYLDEYLFRTRQKQTEFAKKIRCTNEHLCCIIKGISLPSLSLARRIEKESDGHVTWIEVVECTDAKMLERDNQFLSRNKNGEKNI